MDKLHALMNARRKIRQWCFRRQTQSLKGLSAGDAPQSGLESLLEKMPEFDGWDNFGITWVIPRIDVSELLRDGSSRDEIIAMLEAPLSCAVLKFSLEEQWDADVRHHAHKKTKVRYARKPIAMLGGRMAGLN